MRSTARVRAIGLLTVVAALGLSIGAAAPAASAHASPTLVLEWSAAKPVLTLPSSDDFDDTLQLGISSSQPGPAAVSATRLTGHGTGIPLESHDADLGESSPGDYTGVLFFNDSGLTAGSWKISAVVNGLKKTTVLEVGSGVAKSVTVKPLEKTLFTNASEAPSDFQADVVAKDELGTSLPIASGEFEFMSSHHQNSAGQAISSTNPETPGVTTNGVVVGDWNNGTAKITVDQIEGPTTSLHSPGATAHVTLESARVTSASIKVAYSTIYPNITGYHQSETLTAKITTNTGNDLPLASGSYLQIVHGTSGVADTVPIDQTGIASASWNGETSGSVIVGKYNAFVVAILPDGNTVVSETHFSVSAAQAVTKTSSVTYSAKDFLRVAEATAPSRKCTSEGSALKCTSLSGGNVSGGGSFKVPSNVLLLAGSFNYGASVSVTVKDLRGSGTAELALLTSGGTPPEGSITADGVTTTPVSDTFSGTDTRLGALIGLSGACSLEITKVTINYSYAGIG